MKHYSTYLLHWKMEWRTFFVLKQQFPDASPGVGVYSSRGFIQDDNFGTANKRNSDREFPLHATWKAKPLSSATGCGWCTVFSQRYSSLSQQLMVDHPSTLGCHVQELVDWLWSKCVEMYLSILYCLFACCKVIDSVVRRFLGVGAAEDRCTPIQVSALWSCSRAPLM